MRIHLPLVSSICMWLFLIINRFRAVRMILFFTHFPNKNFAQSYCHPKEVWKIQVSWQGTKHDNWWLRQAALLWRFLITTFHLLTLETLPRAFRYIITFVPQHNPKGERANITIITFKNKPLRVREVKWFDEVTQPSLWWMELVLELRMPNSWSDTCLPHLP